MDLIKIKKKNEAFLEIITEPSIEHELAEHFCFFVPGYKFMPAYKNRMWDGKIRLYDLRKKTLYTGLFQYIQEFANARQYDIELDNGSYGMPGAKNKVDIPALLSELTLTAGGNKITPRNYQLEALEHALSNSQSLLLSPTASGKSLIIYMAIRFFLEVSDQSILLIVPTTSLVEQMYSDFADYSQFDEWNVDENCHKIYAGREKYNIPNRVVITTWQSIYKERATWFQPFGMVIGDEAHSFKAKSLTAILEKCTECKFRMGTTGTLDGTETNKLVLEGLFGPTFRVTQTRDLQEKGTLAKIDIDVLLLRYHNDVCHMMQGKTYQEEMDYLVTNEKRNKLITNLTLDQKGNTLVLFQFVEKHGKVLVDMMRDKAGEDRKIFYVSGEVDAADREQIRGIVEKQKNAIIVASLGTFSTGINIRNLHNIVFASPSKSQVKVLQSIGRALRQSDDGSNAKLYDIADDMHIKSHKNFTLRHSAERIKIYTKEQFPYKIHQINLK